MRIALITGSYPPDVCGVGDYTSRLAEALRLQGVTIEIVRDDDWHLINLPRLLRRISALHPDVVHIQYPTVGYGAHLVPQLLSMLVPGVVTLHEVRHAHLLRKLALYLFSVRSKNIIFTTDYERQYASTWAPWISDRCTIIPIGTNIPVASQSKAKELEDIIYFGLIRPQKGLEDIIRLSSLIKESELHLAVRIIGKPHPKCLDYYQLLRNRTIDLPIRWDIDLPDIAAADILSRAAVAYMPFPDGASERRSSLMTLLANGIATVTTQSPTTPSDLDTVVKYAEGPKQALQLIRSLLADKTMLRLMSDHAREYAGKFTWDFIAARHKDVYRRILERASISR